MLSISDVSKEYKTGNFVQKALDHLSLTLRENEFVAILGPSGSGKTTLLNIVGGLDHYDSGDLVIDGTSTKHYSERDWNSYRNHSVGFIFQSYNLIPHQSVLSNVELALTISGVSPKERKRRAAEALQRVGLGDQLHKKPNQLSGGQMQRVAIARALVNEPKILLADEPTGVLDSDTSVQVMELLKEVAKDRLVVMVTHNPELARRYATRIVELKDGRIISDSDPCAPGQEPSRPAGSLRKASMSFLTALGLSLANLWTKRKRTLLVAFAGSIGIIGIALILSLSTGMNLYMDDIQRETLSEYPVSLTKSSLDLSSLVTRDEQEDSDGDKVREWQLVANLFSTASPNDLASFKLYLEEHSGETDPYIQNVEYKYNVAPLIFSERDGEVRQVHPNQSLASLGISSAGIPGFTSRNMTDVFHRMPDNPGMYESQYDVLAGRWPQNYGELVFVLTRDNRVSDMALYAMGFKDISLLDDMVDSFMSGKKVDRTSANGVYAYEDFLGVSFRLVDRSALYTYDESYGVWTDRSSDLDYMKKAVSEGELLKIVGVVRQREDATAAVLSTGMNYMPSLVLHTIDSASDSRLVQDQLASPDVNVFTGALFSEETDASLPDLSSLFSVDADSIADAFRFDRDAISFDMSELGLSGEDISKYIDPNAFSGLIDSPSSADIKSIFDGIELNLSLDSLSQLFKELYDSYLEKAANDPATDVSRLPDALRTYLRTSDARKVVTEHIRRIIRESGVQVITPERLRGFVGRLADDFARYMETAKPLEDVDWPVLEGSDLSPREIFELYSPFFAGYLESDAFSAFLDNEAQKLVDELSEAGEVDEDSELLLQELLADYESYASENGLPELSSIRESFRDYMETEDARSRIDAAVKEMIDTDAIEKRISDGLSRYARGVSSKLSSAMQKIMTQLFQNLSSEIEKAMSDAMSKLPDAFTVDFDALTSSVSMNIDDRELMELASALMSGSSDTFDSNLSRLGYADLAFPSEIVIYPRDFESKNQVIRFIDGYNSQMEHSGESEKVIRYSDMVSTMMNSVTEIINVISYVLIAFVAVSLIVSSIMIGVITYISVLERRKEIGILRAMGASRRNVSSVFNAETMIIGALSGILGITITGLILLPGNYLIHTLTGQENLSATLSPSAAAALVLLSVLLTLVGGFIPAKGASRSDPVAALRSE
ncbi:MAG: ATP-binding cassette domain-containing protein [Oscillospiraceae bacterium]|nr:ATP-binding cassette domain-containing protein [Oscillospiraceae bacterium]